MIYLIDPTKDVYSHHIVYLNNLLKIKGTIALQLNVNTKKMKPNFLSVLRYYYALRKQLMEVPKGNIAHLLYSDIYYKIPFVSSWLLGRNKTIVTMHSFPNGKFKHILLRNFCRRVEMVVVHSQFIKEQFEKIGINNVCCIDYPSFYDYSKLETKEVLRNRAAIKSSSIVFSALGGIRYDKGLDILLNAFKYINEDYKNRIILNVAGSEGFMTSGQIELLCKNLGINHRLTIRPLTDEEFLENVKISDYMVLPYRTNMTGNSGPMTEAIVNTIPSIVPKDSNLGYIAEEYRVGLTFQQENCKDLARCIMAACDNRYNCDEKYANKLSKESFIDAHRKLYKNIIFE